MVQAGLDWNPNQPVDDDDVDDDDDDDDWIWNGTLEIPGLSCLLELLHPVLT